MTITFGELLVSVVTLAYLGVTINAILSINRRLRHIEERTIVIEPLPGKTVLSMDGYRFSRRAEDSPSQEFHA